MVCSQGVESRIVCWFDQSPGFCSRKGTIYSGNSETAIAIRGPFLYILSGEFCPMPSFRTIRSAAYRGWMKFAHVLAVVNTTILLTVVYVVLIGPIALIMKLLRNDPLEQSPSQDDQSFWKRKDTVNHTLSDSKRQF